MKQEYRGAGGFATLGLEIVLCVLVGFFGGRWLDEKFHTEPWLSVFGFVSGCGAAVKALLRAMKEMQAITEREERSRGNPRPLFESAKEREDAREGDSQNAPPSPISPDEQDHDERSP
jgi:hypothetical protein